MDVVLLYIGYLPLLSNSIISVIGPEIMIGLSSFLTECALGLCENETCFGLYLPLPNVNMAHNLMTVSFVLVCPIGKHGVGQTIALHVLPYQRTWSWSEYSCFASSQSMALVRM